jgi:ribosomal-protein-alanine N-acetyltransferase
MTEPISSPVEITTERLRLRWFQPEDFEPLFALYSDLEAMRFIRPGWIPARDEITAYLGRVEQRWREQGFGHLAVTLKATGEFIGYCGFQYVEKTPQVELLYAITQPNWRRGYTTEIARACLEWVFENTSLDRVIALAHPDNVGSWRVMEKVGMKFEKIAHHYNLDLVCYVMERG